MHTLTRLTLLATALTVAPLTASAQAYVATSWNTPSVYLLNADFSVFSSFGLADNAPNGVASNGSLLFTGHFTNSSIVAYNTSGVEQYRFSDSRLSGLQGLTAVGNELAVSADGQTHFFDATTGSFLRSFTNSGSTVEGLAYDGSLLWEIGDNIFGRNVLTGDVVVSFANAAGTCGYGGTGIGARGDGILALGCADGSWYKVSATDGSVLSSGNNGIDMYGLDAFGSGTVVPEPGTYALLGAGLAAMGLVARRRRVRR